MSEPIPSLTEVLEARRRAAEATDTSDSDQALEALGKLDGEFPWPARGEIWEAMARLRTPEAGSRLLAMSKTLTEKPQQKRMRRVIHQLRSRGVPVEDPSSGSVKNPTRKPRKAPTRPAGRAQHKPDLPSLRTWASCADGEGAYQLLAHLHGPTASLAGLACFAVTRGARDFMVFPVDEPRQVDELLDHLDEAVGGGMPPLHPINPENWLALARQAMRDHEEGGFPDPEDLPMWRVLLDGVGQAIGPWEPHPNPFHTPPEDPAQTAADLLDHPGYQTWFFDAKALPQSLVDRAAELVDEPPTADLMKPLHEFTEEALQTVDAAHLKNLWQHMLRYNARVHLALGDSAAEDALWFADLFDTVPFTDHPLTREVARRTPWRLYRTSEEEPDGATTLDDLWEVQGWDALDAFDGLGRLGVAERFVEFWLADSKEAASGREAALKRQWGRNAREYMADSALTLSVLFPASVHFHHWDFRHSLRSKTVAERQRIRIDEVPDDARPFYLGQLNAVTSIYQVLDLAEDGAVIVEDYLNDGRLVVRTHGEFLEEAQKQYPVLIGKVFPVGGQTWLAMACPPLPAQLKPRLVMHLEESLMGRSGLRASVDHLRRAPQAIWRALRAAEGEITREEEAVEELLERTSLPPEEAGPPIDFDDLDEDSKDSIREHLTDHFTKYYMSWLDERIPALGYQTPRKAVREPRGRRQVEDMLREIEAMFARHPQGLDLSSLVAAMRQELGLDA